MNEALLEPRVRADDRLLLTIVIAAAVHVMVVLGVRLPPDAPVKSRFAAMEVVLVPAPVAVPPTTVTDPSAEDSASSEPPLLPMPPVEAPIIKAAPTPTPTPVPQAAAPVKAAPRPEPTRATPPPPQSQAAPAGTTTDTPSPPPAEPPPLPTAAQLIERSLAIAATGAGLIEDRTVSGQSQSERTLYIKNNPRDFTAATYKDDLVRRAKSFGQLFQRDVPPGRLVLDVAIASDGSLASVSVTRSSGIEATDAEAIRILTEAAPFAPLPPEMAKKYDVVHIDLPWNFTKDEGF